MAQFHAVINQTVWLINIVTWWFPAAINYVVKCVIFPAQKKRWYQPINKVIKFETRQDIIPGWLMGQTLIYYRRSIYRDYIWHDIAHGITITMIKLQSDLHSRKAPHTSPLRASHGVSFVSYTKKNDRDISRAHCIWYAMSSTSI